MRNTKKMLRAKLLAKKREDLRLRKELELVDKEGVEAIEIRKLLGIATIQDLLGSKYPIRVCKHCGKRAYSTSELWQFTFSKTSKYNYRNCCTDCTKLKALDKRIQIVGPHCPLVFPKRCTICNRSDSTTGNRSWFIKSALVCKSCLGTHEEVFGLPVPLKEPRRNLLYLGETYNTIQELAQAMHLPYHEVRLLVIQNKLKDLNG